MGHQEITTESTTYPECSACGAQNDWRNVLELEKVERRCTSCKAVNKVWFYKVWVTTAPKGK